MRWSILSVVAGLSLAGAGVVRAQDTGNEAPSDTGNMPGMHEKGGGQMGTGHMGAGEQAGATGNVEPAKHLLEVDAYLKDAMQNTKLLYQSTQVKPGKLDATIQREDIGNVEKALSSALTHISHVKSLPEAKISDTERLNQLQRDVTRAKTLAGQVRKNIGTSDRAQLSTLSSQLYAQLRAADDTFGNIADEMRITRVDRISVPERQPVGGGRSSPSDINMPGGTMEPPKGNQPSKSNQPSRGPQAPGGTNY
jgi:hypothetical protein